MISDRFIEAQKYLKDVTVDFDVNKFINHIKNLKKIDMSAYLVQFTHLFHKSNFMLDLAIYSTTGEVGQRKNDVNEELRPLLAKFIEAAKKEDMEFMAMTLGSLMPIRYYFDEIRDFAIHYNKLVDLEYTDEKERIKKKFMRHELKN